MSQNEHACPSSCPPIKNGLLSTTILNSPLSLTENLMRKAKAALKRVLYTRAGVTIDNTIPEETTYLVPDSNHFGVIQMPKNGSSTGEVWIEPGMSTGTRDVDFKSIASFRGALHYADFNRQLVMESTIEGRFIMIAMTRPDITEIRDQWPVVEYVDKSGEVHSTTFDFWIRLVDGTRVAVAVKPARKVRSSGILEVLKNVQDQGVGGFADRVALVTEVYANHDAAYNAGWKLHARRMRNQFQYLEALDFISDVQGSVRFNDLLQDASSPAGRRVAIWNLLDEGLLVPDATGRIDDLSFLHRATSN
ncbi:hypothetical protein [Agrobacterium sp. NPDC090283]|uniref:hypothetical protein n=1 Tax=Agrobacterium sp. NPDC090283 TaxID=3363920 RepID=UPI00383B89D1